MTGKTETQYQHLEPRPGSNYRTLFRKGRRIRAAVVEQAIHGPDPFTPEEFAEEFQVPLEAVREALKYVRAIPGSTAKPRHFDSVQSSGRGGRQVTGIDPKRIFAAVRSFDGLDDAALSRRHDPHVARAVVAWLCRRHTEASLRELAAWLGLSRADSVPNLTRRIETRLNASPELSNDLAEILKRASSPDAGIHQATRNVQRLRRNRRDLKPKPKADTAKLHESSPVRQECQTPADQLSRLDWTTATLNSRTASSPRIEPSVNPSRRISPTSGEPAGAPCKRSPPPTLKARRTIFTLPRGRTATVPRGRLAR
jgi:hypothetical protein